MVREAMIAVGISDSYLEGFQESVKNQEFIICFEGKSVKFEETDAKVVCRQGFENSEVYLRLKRKREEPEDIFVHSTSTSIFEINLFLVEPVWQSRTIVQIPICSDQVSSFLIDIESKAITSSA